ncbi:MAG: phosphoenolpyruvate synthase [Syntrophaceae bacterium PtaU1.Bin231]|nr:MAG: phosphoenolpyruvate synthase [Syntrophaceae bacterium PtaU1.Bin231]
MSPQQIFGKVSTGLNSLDEVIDSLRIGDNVIWQVDDIDVYAYFVTQYVNRAIADNRKIVYIRFARHKPLLKADPRITVYKLDARCGFESFTNQVNKIATLAGQGVFYVFDCLSDLLSAWATDLMIGNFFLITCPYLFQLNTVAYFSILRDNHSYKTVARIRETTQVLLDVYNPDGRMYVHPLKVWNRYSPTMFLPHLLKGDRFVPCTSSLDATQLFSYLATKGVEQTRRNLDFWDRLFLEAEDLLRGGASTAQKRKMIDKLCQIMIGREERILSLAKAALSLEDLLDIKTRLIGTGYVGGKAAGMLIARNLLLKDKTFSWKDHLEPHDSFYIGSDVFYTYLVENGWWKMRMEQRTQEGYFEAARHLREEMLFGKFPDEIQEQFWRIIEYYGQSPIIIRSSSFLEDAFGNAFAGKYESIFCVNQGSPDERFHRFEEYVRRVYASTMNEDALAYRLQRGLDQQDEQMSLLIQRVSGSYRKHFFFPDLAGVGNSYNTFVWKSNMDPKAGMIRLVLGLGTRAVNRVENDYPRVVALDAPLLRPHSGMAEVKRYSQHYADVLDINRNRPETMAIKDLIQSDLGINTDLLGTWDTETAWELKERGIQTEATWVLTFEHFLSTGTFTGLMRRMMKTLEDAYQYPVDIEFTLNFTQNGDYRVNLVQCRPLQTKGKQQDVVLPTRLPRQKILFQSQGNFMGGNISQPIRRIIYVDPKCYSELNLYEKHDIARLIGKLNRDILDRNELPTLLIGPGRWGTTTPSLGVPVRFAEINRITAMVELEYQSGSLLPELSFGTHFFQDLVETGIFYVAIFPGSKEVIFNKKWLDQYENKLWNMVPEDGRYEECVRVCDIEEKTVFLKSDILAQRVVCYTDGKMSDAAP